MSGYASVRPGSFVRRTRTVAERFVDATTAPRTQHIVRYKSGQIAPSRGRTGLNFPGNGNDLSLSQGYRRIGLFRWKRRILGRS